MKLSVGQLRKIIKEEVTKIISENTGELVTHNHRTVNLNGVPISAHQLANGLGPTAKKLYDDAMERQHSTGMTGEIDSDTFIEYYLSPQLGDISKIAEKYATATGTEFGGKETKRHWSEDY